MGSGNSTPALPPAKELPSLKIALVGDPGVGKTSVLLRYMRNQFSPLYIPTKKVAIENVVRKVNVPANTVVSLTFWDIPGREDMDIHRSYFRNLDAAIVVVDMTNKATIDMANVWKQTVLNKLTRTVIADGNNNKGEAMTEVPVDPVNFPVLLLGNKFDIVEDEIYQDLANRQVSVSVNDQGEPILEHRSIDHLEQVADDHHFIGSVTVSAKGTDNSVSTAIQSLVRNILVKRNVPRKWKPVPAVTKPPKKDRPFIYDKLEKTDIDKVFKMYRYNKLDMTGQGKYDTIIERADTLVKKTVVLRHYYTVSLARFKHVCVQGKLVNDGQEPSLEDCILGMKSGLKEGATLKVIEDECFYKLDIIFDDEQKEVKQSKPWKQAYRVFHNEYASVAKTILKDGPDVCTALEKYDSGFENIYADHTHIPEVLANQKGPSKEEELEKMERANQIVRNRAKVKHAGEAMGEAMQDVEQAGRKIANVAQW